MIRGSRFLLATLLVLSAGARNAAAQEPELSKHDQAVADETVRGRMRSTMHPGDPLKLVGEEQGGNEIRSRTPALQNGAHTAAPVDSEELYQRALAIYGERATFKRPPAARTKGGYSPVDLQSAREPVRGTKAAPPPASSAGASPSHGVWPLLLASSVALALVGWFLRRWRATLFG